jgi:hypothetical protein
MTTSTIDRARLEELLGEYWEIAFEESSGVAATGNKANRVLHEIRALFDVKQAEIARLKTESEERLQNCAALVAENEQLRKDAERYQWLAEYLVSDDESHDDAIVAATTVAELDYVTDAAMKGTP